MHKRVEKFEFGKLSWEVRQHPGRIKSKEKNKKKKKKQKKEREAGSSSSNEHPSLRAALQTYSIVFIINHVTPFFLQITLAPNSVSFFH